MLKERIYRIRAGKSCRIALLSDFHNSDERPVLESLERLRPDLIAVTGDLFLGYRAAEGADLLRTQGHILPLLTGCVKLAPTFFSLGNHEWVVSPSNLKELCATGAALLDNRWTRDVTGRFVIGGLTSGMVSDYRRFRRRAPAKVLYPHETRHTDACSPAPAVRWLDKFEKQEGYRILLCHHPEYWCLQEPMLRDRNIDLVLSGHAHGGQIRLLGRGLYAPGQGILPAYTGGLHSGPHGKLLISRGLSNTALPVPRLFNPPEIVAADLW